MQFYLEGDGKHMEIKRDKDSQKEELEKYKCYLLIADLLKLCFLWIQCLQQMVERHTQPTINMQHALWVPLF